MSSKAKFEEHRGQPFLVQAAPGFLESVPDENTPEVLYEKQERVLNEELDRIFARLPEKESRAIRLWLKGKTQAQIAEEDGVTQAAISIRAKRGLERLFDLRDRGELGALKFIWEGLHKLKNHINQEIAIERATDSDASLPLGEELGESLGEYVYVQDLKVEPVEPRWAKCPADVGDGFDDPPLDEDLTPVETPTAKRRIVQRKTSDLSKCESNPRLNGKEKAVLEAVHCATGPVHISGLQATTFLSNLEVRNSLRKLVRGNYLHKLGKGLYRATSQ